MALTSVLALAAMQMATGAAAPALANQDVVVMRRVLTAKQPSDGSSNQNGWKVGPWSDVSDQCGIVKKTRTVTCQAPNGNCALPKPAEEEEGVGGATNCEHQWKTAGFGEWSTQCSLSATRMRQIQCVTRSGEVVDDSNCEIAYKPDPVETAEILDSCSFEWTASEWTGNCKAGSAQTRSVTCVITQLGLETADAKCTEPKPAITKTVPAEEACTGGNVWQPGPWGAWNEACSPQATRTREVKCVDSNGNTIAEQYCTAPKPSDIDVGRNTAGCETGGTPPYEWYQGPWGAWSSTCSPQANRARAVQCRDALGTAVSPELCQDATPAGKETGSNYEGCQLQWAPQAWGEWNSNCSATATRTRDVLCVRTNGGSYSDTQPSDLCNAADRPGAEETAGVYTGCTFAWKAGQYVTVPACGATVATRSVTCERTIDGEPADDALCTDTRPASTINTTDESLCQYDWAYDEWSQWNSSCSKTAQRSRERSCVRLDTGAEVDAQKCADKPLEPVTETAEITSGCTFAWKTTPIGSWVTSGQCGVDETRQLAVTCARSDGEEVDDALCTEAKPSAVETRPGEACTYSWSATYSPEQDVCGTAVKTGAVVCKSSSDNVVDDSMCNAAERPPSALDYTNYRGCTFSWSQTPTGNWDSTCASNAIRTTSITCKRSDGADALEEQCNPGTRPTENESGLNTAGCNTVLANGSFETTSSWTQSGTAIAISYGTSNPSPDGGRYASMNNGIEQTTAVALKSKSKYRIEFWGRNLNTSGFTGTIAPNLSFKVGPTRYNYTSSVTTISPSATWTFYTVTFTPNATAPDVSQTMQLSFISNARGAGVDGVRIYAIAQ